MIFCTKSIINYQLYFDDIEISPWLPVKILFFASFPYLYLYSCHSFSLVGAAIGISFIKIFAIVTSIKKGYRSDKYRWSNKEKKAYKERKQLIQLIRYMIATTFDIVKLKERNIYWLNK